MPSLLQALLLPYMCKVYGLKLKKDPQGWCMHVCICSSVLPTWYL